MIILTAILLIVAGAAHAMRDRYHADPSIFENWIKGTDKDFFGANAWLTRYNNNDVSQGPKWIYRFIGNFDFWHVARYVENFCVAGAILALTGRWEYAVGYLIIISASAHLTYTLIRRPNREA